MRILLALLTIISLNACTGTSPVDNTRENEIRECINEINNKTRFVQSESCRAGNICGGIYVYNDTYQTSLDKSYPATTDEIEKFIEENTITTKKEYLKLSQTEALKITKNWDYNNIKLYDNADWTVKEHEFDACDALSKLKVPEK